jgi:hypothetical protein
MIEHGSIGLDFGSLRRAVERRELDRVLGFYAEKARLTIIDADAPLGPPFELSGRAEIAKYLRAVFGREILSRIEGEVVADNRVEYREACEYPDGVLVWVRTTLEVAEGKILRQIEVVSREEGGGCT